MGDVGGRVLFGAASVLTAVGVLVAGRGWLAGLDRPESATAERIEVAAGLTTAGGNAEVELARS